MDRMKNFGDLPDDYSALESARIVILPVPYDRTSTWIKGADNGPAAMLEASGNINLNNILAVAQCGVDRIAIGALTHSAAAVDIGLDR